MLQQVHKYNETITVVNASFYPCIFLFLAVFSLQIHAKKAVSKASNFFWDNNLFQDSTQDYCVAAAGGSW